MAKKIYNAGTHFVTVTKDAKISRVGLNAENCDIVFKNGKPALSWKPEREIQQFEEVNKGEKLEIRLLKRVTLNHFEKDGEV